MKCGICQKPLSSLVAFCGCNKDPHAGWELAARYRLLGRVAKGGMGMIYRALALEDERLCAIKISRWSEALQQLRQLEPEAARKEEEARVGREFKLLEKASSQSPHIVQVFDQMRDDPRIGLYYPMEFLEGQPLSKHPQWGTPFPSLQVVELILQICDGIAVAHGLGVVHRDLNPDNIFIVRHKEKEQFVKLIDFGIARDLYARRDIYNTGHDLAFGHLHYMAPEQVGYSPVTGNYDRETAAKLDTRADIYTIGAIMFHMLTGFPPFEDDTLEGLAVREWESPENVHLAKKEGLLPGGLRDIISSCLEASPDQRPPDIFVLSDMLRTFQDNHEVIPPAPFRQKMDSDDLLQAAPPLDLWDAFGDGTAPSRKGGLDEFSGEFDTLFNEEDIDLEEVRTEEASRETPDKPEISIPNDVLAALENAPTFFDSQDNAEGLLQSQEAMRTMEESLTLRDALNASILPPAIRPLPTRSPHLEESFHIEADAAPPQNGSHSNIDFLIEETLATGHKTKSPKDVGNKGPVIALLVGGIILLAIGAYFLFLQ